MKMAHRLRLPWPDSVAPGESHLMMGGAPACFQTLPPEMLLFSETPADEYKHGASAQALRAAWRLLPACLSQCGAHDSLSMAGCVANMIDKPLRLRCAADSDLTLIAMLAEHPHLGGAAGSAAGGPPPPTLHVAAEPTRGPPRRGQQNIQSSLGCFDVGRLEAALAELPAAGGDPAAVPVGFLLVFLSLLSCFLFLYLSFLVILCKEPALAEFPVAGGNPAPFPVSLWFLLPLMHRLALVFQSSISVRSRSRLSRRRSRCVLAVLFQPFCAFLLTAAAYCPIDIGRPEAAPPITSRDPAAVPTRLFGCPRSCLVLRSLTSVSAFAAAGAPAGPGGVSHLGGVSRVHLENRSTR